MTSARRAVAISITALAMAFLAACTGDDEPAPAVATESPSTPGATASPATLTPTPRATPSPSPTATPDPGPDLQSEGVQYLAYVDPDGVLWRVDELGGSRVRLAEGCGPEPPVWSLDGGWIACATGGGTLLLNSFAGSDAARADLQCGRAPKWPFGGALLACSPDRVADRNGERIAKFDEERYVQDFVWSPDGQYLIYEREDDPDRPFSLVLSDSAGNELGTIMDTRGNVFGVDWSADGSRLTYVSYTEGSSANDGEIVLVDVPSLRRTVVDTSSLGRTAFGLGSVRRGGLPLTWALDDSVILVSGQARHEGGPMIVLDVDSGAFTDARPPNFWALAPDRRTVAILVPEHACILRIGIGEIGNSAVLAIPGSDWGEATCEGGSPPIRFSTDSERLCWREVPRPDRYACASVDGSELRHLEWDVQWRSEYSYPGRRSTSYFSADNFSAFSPDLRSVVVRTDTESSARVGEEVPGVLWIGDIATGELTRIDELGSRLSYAWRPHGVIVPRPVWSD